MAAAVAAAALEKLLGKILDFAMEKMLERTDESIALSMAIFTEYAYRTDIHVLTAARKLKNHCSECHCKGHNKQNHSVELTKFLELRKYGGMAGTIIDIFEGADLIERVGADLIERVMC